MTFYIKSTTIIMIIKVKMMITTLPKMKKKNSLLFGNWERKHWFNQAFINANIHHIKYIINISNNGLYDFSINNQDIIEQKLPFYLTIDNKRKIIKLVLMNKELNINAPYKKNYYIDYNIKNRKHHFI